MHRWPTHVPYRPLSDEYRRQEVDKRLRFDTESGEPKTRPRTSRRSWLHEMTVVVPRSLRSELDQFWDELGQGVLWFVYPEDPFTEEEDVSAKFESVIDWSPSGEVDDEGRPSWRAHFVLRTSSA